MSDQMKEKTEHNDSTVDAMVAVIVIGVVVSAVVFWLSGQ